MIHEELVRAWQRAVAGVESLPIARQNQPRQLMLITEAKEANRSPISTFDVFDTVITRAVAEPATVYLLLGRRLAKLSVIRCTPEAFAHARGNAGRRAWQNASGNEPTLKQIYRELRASLSLTEEQMHKLMNLELELESELIRVVPEGRDRIRQTRTNGHRIVFLSDMYVPSKFIQKLLARHGLWADGDEIHVSCERRKSKRSGQLFQELMQRENVSPSFVRHHGNHAKADIQAPKRMGLQVHPMLKANPNRYERILESHSFATEGLSSVMAGASRLARLNIPVTTAKEQALRDVAAGVIAPLLIGFTLWLLQRAQTLGLERLYFLSRDGQILLEIARVLADRLNLTLDLRYLYGSREALSLPSTITANEQELSQLFFGGCASVNSFLSKANVVPEQISDSLETIGIRRGNWSGTLNTEERRSLFQLALQDQLVRELILARAVEQRAVLVKYMKQEDMFDSAEWGIVDLGWRGTIQNALNRILSIKGQKVSIGFYFGVRDNEQSHPSDNREGYYFDERFGWGLLHLFPRFGVQRVLEAFCYADHGTVLGFEASSNRVHPVLKEQHNQHLLAWGLPLLRSTVRFCAENMVLDSSLVSPAADVRAATAEALKAFWLKPSREEAAAFGAMPYDVGFGKNSYQLPFATRYGWKQVAEALWRANGGLQHPGMWEEGSLTLTPATTRSLMKATIWLSRVMRHFVGFLRQYRVYAERLSSSPVVRILSRRPATTPVNWKAQV